jgi:imidazolonepropionase-like amidohydrolase
MTRFRTTALVVGIVSSAILWPRAFHAQTSARSDGTLRYYAANAMPTVIEGMRLIDGVSDAPVDDGVMVIENGVITAVGRRGTVTIPARAERISAAGKTIMPAIIALHAHVGRNRADVYPDLIDNDVLAWGPGAVEQTRESIQRAANAYLYYGVTHNISLGYDQQPIIDFIADQRAGKIGGARIYSAGTGYAVKEYRADDPDLHRPTTAEEARAMVRREAAKSLGTPSFTKIWVDDSRSLPKLTPEVYGAIIDESHRHGKRVVAHTFSLEDGKELMRRGVDAITHTVQQPVDGEYLRLAKDNNVTMIFDILRANESHDYIVDPRLPLLFPASVLQIIRQRESASARESQERAARAANADRARRMTEAARAAGITDQIYVTADLREINALSLRQAARMAAAGVTFAIGSDSGEPHNFSGQSEHREMETLVNGGIPAMQVLKAATASGAKFLGIDDTHGTLVPGKRANFLVLAANPLTDIRNTLKLDDVWVNGRRVDRSSLERRPSRSSQ